MLWKQDLVHRYSKNKIRDKKNCCHGTAVTMATNAYFGPAKYPTLYMIVTHLQRKSCCYTVKEKYHAI